VTVRPVGVVVRPVGVARDPRDWNPLGPATDEPLTLSGLAARAAAAIRHAKAAQTVDEVDLAALVDLRDLLSATAEALEFVESGGSTGQIHARSFATMTALEVLADVETPQIDQRELRGWLQDFVRRLDEFANAPTDSSLSDAILPFLTALSDAAIRLAGTTGEVNTTF
jgi:hypothetical protein